MSRKLGLNPSFGMADSPPGRVAACCDPTKPPCPAGRFLVLDRSEIGNADQAACAHYAEDVAGCVCGLIHNSIGLDHELAKSREVREMLLECAFGNTRAAKGKFCQMVDGVVDLEEPLCRRGDVAFGGDRVVDFVELAERRGRPDDVHIPCLSRNCRMAVLWSMPRPSAISLRDLRTVSARRNTSISGSKSAALTRTASARPLRVTMSGRCVSLTRAKHAARLLRHSENGMMSSVRRGRRGVAVRVFMGDLLLVVMVDIVQKNVQLVKASKTTLSLRAVFGILFLVSRKGAMKTPTKEQTDPSRGRVAACCDRRKGKNNAI